MTKDSIEGLIERLRDEHNGSWMDIRREAADIIVKLQAELSVAVGALENCKDQAAPLFVKLTLLRAVAEAAQDVDNDFTHGTGVSGGHCDALFAALTAAKEGGAL